MKLFYDPGVYPRVREAKLLHTSAICILAVVACNSTATAVIDLNGNGVSDLWEQKYNATDLVADATKRAEDEDKDGQSNEEEAIAGTDPRDPLSVHTISQVEKSGTDVTLHCPTEKGKRYQVSESGSLQQASWQPYGTAKIATSNSMTAVITGQTGNNFFRVIVDDADSDGDNIPDWAEEQMEGFDPGNSNSFGAGPDSDMAAFESLLNAVTSDEISITATATEAFEKENTPATFTISRSGATTYPHTVFFSLSGHTNPSKGSALPDDYVLKNTNGDILDGSITIPAGASSVEVHCHPVLDTKIEVPETLTCTISGASAASASVRICDATNTLENARLLVAQLGPEGSAITTASGLSTILVRGDNEIGSVNLNFYGLTSPQTAVHIHIKNPVSGPHVESLPMGQVDTHQWNILAAHFLTTDQAVLDALLGGGLYINVHSMNYPGGEIRGDFLVSTGSTELVIPTAPPAITPLTGDALDQDIARFLTQSTFGPTPALMTELRTLINSAPHNGDQISAYGAWLDAQMAVASPDLEPYIHAADAQQRFLAAIPGSPNYNASYSPGSTNRRRAWWLLATQAPDQVRQRMAFALSEIFVASEGDGVVEDRHYGHAHYYDMLKNGAFGSYRDLLEGVSTHPIMGQYLSHLRNSKEITDAMGNVIVSPDENYAREVMQLFSIGLVLLHEDGSLKLNAQGLPDPTYLQDDITAMSRVFTGWSFSKRNNPSASDTVADNTSFTYGNGSRYYQAQWSNRMKNFAAYHDTGEKIVPTLGLTINAGGDGESDMDAVMNHLAAHSNTAPFIIRRLIQRLVTSNPSAGYIYRVTQAWKASNGNLGAVCKAILLDYEARSISATAPVTYGKKKEPIVHFVALSRALGATSLMPLSDIDPADTSVADLSSYAYSPSNLTRFTSEITKFPGTPVQFRLTSTESGLGQQPQDAPTVFNWFLPDYTVVGPLADAGLRTPEFQIANEISVITNVNYHYSFLYGGSGLGANSLPNQKAHVSDTDNSPHPVYNPYQYGDNDDHIIYDQTGASAAGQAYLAIMDTSGDGKVTSADTTFDDRPSIVSACVALVDHLDLLLCSGRLKSEYGSGYVPETVRADNPRDIIIKTVSDYSTSWDDNDNDTDQALVLRGRIRLAAYLISVSPYSLIQK